MKMAIKNIAEEETKDTLHLYILLRVTTASGATMFNPNVQAQNFLKHLNYHTCLNESTPLILFTNITFFFVLAFFCTW